VWSQKVACAPGAALVKAVKHMGSAAWKLFKDEQVLNPSARLHY
jgi:hypothetical protein